MNPTFWREYDAAAEWCAKHGYRGVVGDPLPALLSNAVVVEIEVDPEAFEARVKASAYALVRTRPCGHPGCHICDYDGEG